MPQMALLNRSRWSSALLGWNHENAKVTCLFDVDRRHGETLEKTQRHCVNLRIFANDYEF
jgi:hypothetical protein